MALNEIKTIDSFSKKIESYIKTNDGKILYRGIGKTSYSLLPSLYRHSTITNIGEFKKLERSLLQEFQSRSIPFVNQGFNRISDDWDTLFLMQHYGVPTRLLDWTENPFIALYFALTSASYDKMSKTYMEDSGIWVVNASNWNKAVINKSGFDEGILSHKSEKLAYYDPVHNDNLPDWPLFINGVHNSQRIVSQKGVFSIFGEQTTPMENAKIKIGKKDLKLLIIPKDTTESLLNSLLSIGITDSVVFPDLEGLAKELRRNFRYEVGYV
jgi:hypothetical protein